METFGRLHLETSSDLTVHYTEANRGGISPPVANQTGKAFINLIALWAKDLEPGNYARYETNSHTGKTVCS